MKMFRCILLTGMVQLCFVGGALAVPATLNYQGRLTTTGGAPVVTAKTITFTFWDALTGGNQLGNGYSDARSVTPNSDGLYSTLIGSPPGTEIPASVFQGDTVYLNVNVAGEDLAPRLQVSSAAFAIKGPNVFPAFVTVITTDSTTTNGLNLLAAYAKAKTLTPQGAARSATNRVTVIVPPGNYDLGSTQFTLDTAFVDVIGQTSERENQHIYGSPGINAGVLHQTISTNNVRIENLFVECTTAAGGGSFFPSDPAAYFPESAATDFSFFFPSVASATVIKNCHFKADDVHAWSMRLCGDQGGYSGTYTDCVAGKYAFGSHGTASSTGGFTSGTLTNCTAGDFSFASGGTANGTFINCTGGINSFGGIPSDIQSSAGWQPVASGTFTDCTGGNGSFGAGGVASGTFTNCKGGNESFGGVAAVPSYPTLVGTSTGAKLSYCEMTGDTWTPEWAGKMDQCRWGTGFICAATARIYDSTILGTLDLNGTAAGVVHSKAQDIINQGSNTYGPGNADAFNIANPDVQ